MCEDLSFSNIFKDKKFGNVGEYLDSLAFKIYDYAFCDTREQQMDRYHKVFGDSSYRTIQIFFAQKGQLWLLNMLNNVAEWAGGKSQKEIDKGLKDFLRDAADKDFSPYHDKTSKEKMDKIIQDLIEKGKKATKKCKEGTELPSTFKVKENRMLVLGKGNFKNSLDTYTPMTKINKKFNTILENEVVNISPIREKSKTFVEKYLERNNKQQQNTFNI